MAMHPVAKYSIVGQFSKLEFYQLNLHYLNLSLHRIQGSDHFGLSLYLKVSDRVAKHLTNFLMNQIELLTLQFSESVILFSY